MNEIALWDHLFAFVVFVAYPFHAWRTFPAFAQRVRERGEPAKIAGYRGTIALWVVAAAALSALWFWRDRSWAELGIGSSTPFQLLAGLALAGAFLALILVQWRQMRRSDEAQQGLVEQLGDLAAFMPSTAREERWFRAVSVNAGLTEELIYRGFLLWYAALLAVAAFTLGHAYQGAAQVPALVLTSSVLVGVYLLSGSLLLPIVLHAAVDVIHGRYLAQLFGGGSVETAA